jgi:hypothetical protein
MCWDLIKQWLLDWSPGISILLTLAIAAGAVAQVFAVRRSNDLQKSVVGLQAEIEAANNRISLFFTFQFREDFATGAVFMRITNLSRIGVWIEDVVVKVTMPNGDSVKSEPIKVKEALSPCAESSGVPISPHLQEYIAQCLNVEVNSLPSEHSVKFLAEVRCSSGPTLEFRPTRQWALDMRGAYVVAHHYADDSPTPQFP